MNDDLKLMKETVRDFSTKNIENIALKIEREGIDKDLLKKLAEQGFLGATAPQEYGGAELDNASYRAILEELSSFSPSVGVLVFLYNSIASKLLKKGKAGEYLKEILSGESTLGFGYGEILEGYGNSTETKGSDGRTILKRDVIFPTAKKFIVLDDTGENLILANGKIKRAENKKSLGIRGLGISDVLIETSGAETLGNRSDIVKAIEDSSLEIAAIYLGIIKGSLNKAIDYAKVRTTFDHFLKDYSPVAFSLSSLRAEEELLRSYIYESDADFSGGLSALIFSESLSKRATKQALQTHGGYGYLEDFGVEKFYRDAMTISTMLFRGRTDRKRLSEEVFGTEAGNL